MRFIGLDLDKPSLSVAERRIAKSHLSVELKEAFAESLPLADQSIDICFSTLAFHHMPDSVKRDAIKEIYRVLKNSGTIVIADFGARKNIVLRKFLFLRKLNILRVILRD
ncbi:MAG: class I SAM-dependent methyltransferase [Candidatus Sungiibacteriota bacterium]